MARVALVVLLAACSDPAAIPDAGTDAAPDAVVDLLAVSPIGHDFGDYEVGSADPPLRMTFELGVIGATTVELTAIDLTGAAAADFTIAANDCGNTLSPAQICNIRVEFVASAVGERVAMLQIAGASSLTIPLSGTGVAPAARIRFSPPVHNFGDVAVGATVPMTFTVSNETVATTLAPSLVGAGASAFRIASTDCTTGTIPLHGTCTVQVEMVPGFGSLFIADLVLTDGGGTTWSAGLQGTSLTPLALTPHTGLYASMLIGQPAAGDQVTFTLQNTGASTTGPITAMPIGAAAADFTVRSTTCTTLAPAATCVVVVEMTPASRGAKYAQIAVTDTVTETRSNLRGDAYSLFLSGTAAFPDTASGGQSAIRSFSVLNASDLATGPITTTQGGTNPTQFVIVGNDCATGIPAHNQCTIMVRFAPTSTGAKAASLIVSSTPGGSDTVTLSGRGL